MKALWLTPHDNGSDLIGSYCTALTEKGHEMSILCLRELTVQSNIEVCRSEILKAALAHDSVVVTMYPDSVELSREFLQALSAVRPLALVAFDDEIYFQWSTYYYIDYFDRILTTDRNSLFWMQDQDFNAAYVPLYNMNAHRHDIGAAVRDIDVLFVGSLSTGGRRSAVESLRHQGFNVWCAGEGTERGKISEAEYWEMLCRTKVVLNFTEANAKDHVLRSDPSRKYVRQGKGRPFEALLCGAHVLSEPSSVLFNAVSESGGVTFVSDIGNGAEQLTHLLENIKDEDRETYRSFVVDKFGIDQFIRALDCSQARSTKGCVSRLSANDQFAPGYGGFLGRIYLRLIRQSWARGEFKAGLMLLREYFRLQLYRYIVGSIALGRRRSQL